MLKDSEISRYSGQRAHRSYTPEFKAELVAACQRPGASIAALAGQHGMNANVLHRWRKEHQQNGCHGLVAQPVSSAPELCAFVPVQLAASPPVAKAQAIKIKVHKGALSMVVTWPVSAAADFASWTTAVLK
jgi:transposase-like protein